MKKKRRINTITGTTRTVKRTRPSRSFPDTESLSMESASLKKVKTVKRSDGIRSKKKTKKIIPSDPVVVPHVAVVSQKKSRKKQSFSFVVLMSILQKQWFWLRYMVMACVVVGIMSFFNAHEHTVISVRPHYEYVDLDQDLVLSQNPKEGQLGFDVMAITDKVTIEVVPEAERKVEKSASGRLKVYNNYSTEPQRLLPNTRFESAGGKIFTLGSEPVIVPGKQDSGPGTIEVSVYASESGPEYNIEPTDFTIPGFKEVGLDEKYNNMYATSVSSFSGGESGTENYVSKEQKDRIRESLTKKLNNRLRERLLAELQDQLILVHDSLVIQHKDLVFDTDPEDEFGIISYSGTLFAMVLHREKLHTYIEDHISFSDSKTNIRQIHDLEITLNETLFDYKKDTQASVRIVGSPLLEFAVDEEILLGIFTGLSLDEVVVRAGNIPFVDVVYVQVRPFWKKHISETRDTISFEYDLL